MRPITLPTDETTPQREKGTDDMDTPAQKQSGPSWHCLLNRTTETRKQRTDGWTRGSVPEDHICVDCGFDTAPGIWTREQTQAAFRIGMDAIPHTLSWDDEVYTVRDAVWKRAGMQPWGGCLCIGCIEKRLGRRLKPKDFVRDHQFNHPGYPGSERLKSRQGYPAHLYQR